MSAFTKELLAAASQSIQLLPQVTTAAGVVIAKSASAAVNGLTMVDEGFAYGADYMSDIRKDQLALLALKQDYRDVIEAKAKAAVVAGDEDSILAAYKKMQSAFEDID